MSSHLKLVKASMPRPDNEPPVPDEVLVGRARDGDRAALGELVQRHQRALFALCLRYVGDRDEAADLVQRAFVRVMGRLDDLREAGLFRAWIFRIGAHLALNHIRDHARFVPDEDQDDRAADPTRPEANPALERLEAEEVSADLKAAVARLPTKQRMTLELRIYEELPFRSIAEALEISEGAAKVNFHYAVRNLRKLLAPASDGATTRGRVR